MSNSHEGVNISHTIVLNLDSHVYFENECDFNSFVQMGEVWKERHGSSMAGNESMQRCLQ